MLDSNLYNTIKKEALAKNLEPALLLAVIDVESSGTPFWNINGVNKPVMRFEGHYFYRLLSPDKRSQAVKEGLASPKVGGVANPVNGAARYTLLDRAKAIDTNAALESCSWGLGQVIGENWQGLGYSSVQDLVANENSVQGQIDAIFRFIDKNNLLDKLRKKDWKGFARVYNGPSFGNYDQKLALAYKKYQNVVDINDNGLSVDIKQMQVMLNSVGSYKLILNGELDSNTKIAIKDFQLKNGLVDDGKYGKLTKDALTKAYVDKSKHNQGMFGGATAAIGTAGTAISQAGQQIQEFAYSSSILQIVCIALIVVGVAASVYSLFIKKD